VSCSGDQSNISLAATSRLLIGFSGSRLTVEATRCRPLAISRIEEPEAIPREMSSRSPGVSVRSERRRTDGKNPPGRDTKGRIDECSLPNALPSHATTVPTSHGTPIALLGRRKSKPFLSGHRHDLGMQSYAGWCCIHGFSPQR
jgi:hypothetical protein